MRAICIISLLALSGCGGAVAAGGALGAISTGIQYYNYATQVLSDTAKIACEIQAVANATGDSRTSYAAGSQCTW